VEAIGAFLALLEMTRARIIQLDQTADRTGILVKLVDERNVPKLLQEISERHVGTGGAPDAKESKVPVEAASKETPAAEEIPAQEPQEAPSKETAARPAPSAEPEVDEEADEEIEKIRRIEIHEVDLDEKQTDADSATQKRTDLAPLAEEPTEEKGVRSPEDKAPDPFFPSPDAGPPKRPIGEA
jgi:hypothetical protein